MELNKAIDAVNSAKTAVQETIMARIKANNFNGVKVLAGAQQRLEGVAERLNGLVEEEKAAAAEKEAAAKDKAAKKAAAKK